MDPPRNKRELQGVLGGEIGNDHRKDIVVEIQERRPVLWDNLCRFRDIRVLHRGDSVCARADIEVQDIRSNSRRMSHCRQTPSLDDRLTSLTVASTKRYRWHSIACLALRHSHINVHEVACFQDEYICIDVIMDGKTGAAKIDGTGYSGARHPG